METCSWAVLPLPVPWPMLEECQVLAPSMAPDTPCTESQRRKWKVSGEVAYL